MSSNTDTKQSCTEANMKPEVRGKYEVFENGRWVLKGRDTVGKIKAKREVQERLKL